MKKKRMISILLIMSLILSNLTVVYGMENEPQGDPVTTEEAVDGSTGSAISDGAISDGAVIEQEPTEQGIRTQTVPERTMTALAVENYFVKKMSSTGTMTKVGTGYDTLAKANTAMKAITTDKNALVVTDKYNKVLNMNNGMAYFKKTTATANIGNTYITPKDALHFYSGNGTTATVGISGAKASVSVSNLTLVPGILVNTDGFYKKDYYYRSSNGDLWHFVYQIKTPNNENKLVTGKSTIPAYTKNTGCTSTGYVYVVDKAPSWMKQLTNYYSADGINFYTNTAMTTKVGTPYYSYYKYLPYRSTTGYTYAQLNKWIASKTSTGKLVNQGSAFINAQNKYGINAVPELAFACLESNYGRSSIALNKTNLFGINAVDSNTGLAYTYSSVASCVNEHAYKYMSKAYGDAKTDSRYFGLTPGNKAVGVNVKYASDPWHGEQISGISYSMDKYLGGKDYRKYSIGVTNKNSVNVYKYAGSTYLYNLSTKSAGSGPTGIPVIILGSYGDYYVIQSDLPISGNTASYSYTYSFNNSKAYVKKSDITKVNSGSVTSIAPSPAPPAPKPPAPKPVFKFGVYNSKTKLWNKSKKGRRTTVKRTMKISTKVKTNSKKTTVKMIIYNKNKKKVAQKVQYIYKTKTVNFSWNGKYTYHNKLRKKAGKYAPYSKKGTKYYVRFVASRKGTKTHYGKYHAFYLYK